ncbi:hypothetical protein H0I76_17725 [Limibaculum sp. M0105]|uniref:MAPEG family protein n=1 Tax=Thermohalobaculum xanthum TaxID=2753746 RepID=A0A8J7MAY0_9RHOB|nr:MAPEG family protein [Thermohalobaculum xanthum]MBK0401040.1 hypothetical protein [Thermohalobaculum xanthum]
MTRDQRIVALGASSGVAAMVAAVVFGCRLVPPPAGLDDLAARLGYTLRMNAIAALPLLVGIIVVGNNRFFSDAINPLLNKETPETRINAQVVENTLQQYVLFLVGTLALSTVLGADQMAVIPVTVTIFVVARVAFWIGYRIHPLYRAFGMAATGYMNLGIIAYVAWHTVVQLD